MNIDINTLSIPFNLVLVKLDDDFETYHNTDTGDNTGLYVAPWGINQSSHLAVTGTVVKLPQKLIYNGYTMAKLKQDKLRSPQDQQHIANLRIESMAYDVPMELTEGLKVYFEYSTRLNAFKEGRAFENEQGKFIFIPYDLLIMVFRPDTNFDDVKITDIYMLNGMVLIKPLEYATEKSAQGIKGNKTEMDIFMPATPDNKYVKRANWWYATVLTAGCGVRSYADFPGRGGEFEAKNTPGCKPGNKILYDGRQQKRLEVEHHRVIFKKHIFYRIHRKDIWAWFPDGDVAKLPVV